MPGWRAGFHSPATTQSGRSPGQKGQGSLPGHVAGDQGRVPSLPGSEASLSLHSPPFLLDEAPAELTGDVGLDMNGLSPSSP